MEIKRKLGQQFSYQKKTDFKIKTITRDKEGHYILIKGSIQEEDFLFILLFPHGHHHHLHLHSYFQRIKPRSGDPGCAPLSSPAAVKCSTPELYPTPHPRPGFPAGTSPEGLQGGSWWDGKGSGGRFRGVIAGGLEEPRGSETHCPSAPPLWPQEYLPPPQAGRRLFCGSFSLPTLSLPVFNQFSISKKTC